MQLAMWARSPVTGAGAAAVPSGVGSTPCVIPNHSPREMAGWAPPAVAVCVAAAVLLAAAAAPHRLTLVNGQYFVLASTPSPSGAFAVREGVG